MSVFFAQLRFWFINWFIIIIIIIIIISSNWPKKLFISQSLYSVFTAYIMLFISNNCRLHVGQVVIRDKLIIR